MDESDPLLAALRERTKRSRARIRGLRPIDRKEAERLAGILGPPQPAYGPPKSMAAAGVAAEARYAEDEARHYACGHRVDRSNPDYWNPEHLDCEACRAALQAEIDAGAVLRTQVVDTGQVLEPRIPRGMKKRPAGRRRRR